MKNSPENPIPLGEWFYPFIEYNDLPYNKAPYLVKSTDIPLAESLSAYVSVANHEGPFYLNETLFYFFNGQNGLTISSLIYRDFIKSEQRKNEVMFMEIGIILYGINQLDSSDWLCTIRLPNRTILTQNYLYELANEADITQNKRAFIKNWVNPITGEVYSGIIVPGTEYILSKIAFNIMRSNEKMS